MNIKVLDKISISVLCVCIFIPQSFIVYVSGFGSGSKFIFFLR